MILVIKLVVLKLILVKELLSFFFFIVFYLLDIKETWINFKKSTVT
nr:MAG TPA: hypothetical protein [Caudoviricetes sp.]